MPATAQQIVGVADTEWTHWGRATWNTLTGAQSKGFHRDEESAFASYARATYCAPLIANLLDSPSNYPTANAIGNDDYPWSAVAMSYFMRTAGMTRTEFRFSQSHSTYIRQAIKARQEGDTSVAYWGFRPTEAGAAPAVGDLVAYARGTNLTPAKVAAFFDKQDSYLSHTDLVVAKRAGEIDVIGGNVRDSVTKKTLRIGANGLLTDTSHQWFAVLKKRQA